MVQWPESHSPTSFPWMSSSKLTSFHPFCSWMFSTYYPPGVMPSSYLSERESGEENLSWLISLVWDGDYKQFVTLCIYVLKVLQGLCHQEGFIHSGQICFPLISLEGEYSLSTEIFFFIFLLSFGACTIHHQMNNRFPERRLRFIPHSIQMARNIESGQRSGGKVYSIGVSGFPHTAMKGFMIKLMSLLMHSRKSLSLFVLIHIQTRIHSWFKGKNTWAPINAD